MIIYFDESGNTGIQKMNNGAWNFNEQPYFVLTGILINNDNETLFCNRISSLKTEFKIEGEIKYKNKSIRKNADIIVMKLIDIIHECNGKIMIEVVNKKFDICKWITNYCFIPYYDSPQSNTEERYIIGRCIANYVYTKVEDKLLNSFLTLVDSEQKSARKLRSYCLELYNTIDNELLKEALEMTRDSIKKYKKLGLQVENLFPLADKFSNGSTYIAVCPNIDSFNNIISKCSCMSNDIHVKHDDIKQLEQAIKLWCQKHMEINDNINIEIDFLVSKNELGIQVSDFISGFVREKMNIDSKNIIVDENFNKLRNNLNIVSSFEDVLRVHPNHIRTIEEKKNFIDFIKA